MHFFSCSALLIGHRGTTLFNYVLFGASNGIKGLSIEISMAIEMRLQIGQFIVELHEGGRVVLEHHT